MTGVIIARHTRRDARSLRFLLLLLGGWTLVRVMAHWNPAIPSSPPGMLPPPWAGEAMPAPWATAEATPRVTLTSTVAAGGREKERMSRPPPQTPVADTDTVGGEWGGGDRHNLRLALMARLLPPQVGGASAAAFPAGASAWVTAPLPARAAPPGRGQPFWMQRQLAGWSLGSWAYMRSGSGDAPPGGIAAASQLGGSQAGARLAFGFGDSGRVRAYGRATLALAETRQRELAFGLAFAPARHLPLDVAIEQRVAAGSGGRTALAAMVSGGVGDVALPRRFRLEAYGQAGIVGARRRDGFADAAVVVDREIARIPQASLHLGALAAGAVQPGAGRVDVGPRLTLRLPEVGEGSRLALDWRQRVAGDAKPGSGLALTLAADF